MNRRPRAVWRRQGFSCRPDSLIDFTTQRAAVLGSRGLDIFQADRLSGVLLTDRTAQEMVLMKHAHFTQVARIVANRHRLPDIGGERGIEIPNSLEVDAVAAHDARPGDP